MDPWQAHGTGDRSFVQANRAGHCREAPAVAAHRGHLWCVWTDLQGHVWYAVTTEDGQFGNRIAFPCGGRPVMANLNGHLHVLIAFESGQVVHYLFDDEDTKAWQCLGPVDSASRVVVHSNPSLITFHNKLFLAFLKDEQLYYCIWSNSIENHSSGSNPSGRWSDAVLVGQGQAFVGRPALFVMNDALYLVCGVDSESGQIVGYLYDYIAAAWSQCEDVSEGRAVGGVSTASYGNSAFLGFIDRSLSNRVVLVRSVDRKWGRDEPLKSESGADLPQLAVLNGRIHCIFNDNTVTKDLRWYSCPLLPYSLSSWMGRFPDGLMLSSLTIPGTHDSCARSNIPFVRTQYLSITQQLALGIRFIDLRLRRSNNGKLFCYHGGVPINLPGRLSFESVLSEIWAFLRGRYGALPATETVLVSIDNDDVSEKEASNPVLFYRAVEEAIALTSLYPDRTSRWFVEPITPTLGQVRGRAVLLRRYASDPALAATTRQGLDLNGWLQNNPHFKLVTPNRELIWLQDKWKYAERIGLANLVESKVGFVRTLLDEAAVDAGPDWFINFCSAVGDPVEHGEVAEAKWIVVGAHSDWSGKWVDGVNVRVRAAVFRWAAEGKARLGIVNMDYPELPESNDLVAQLIDTNFI